MKKRTLLLILAIMLIVPATHGITALAIDIDDPEVFVKQDAASQCTLASNVMMLRRKAILNGDPSWASITSTTLASKAWISAGMLYRYTYGGITVNAFSMQDDMGYTLGDVAGKKEYFINQLQVHPEGIVIYIHHTTSTRHAILLTDYDAETDTFYCSEPANNTTSGRIPLTSSILPSYLKNAGFTATGLSDQDLVIGYIQQIWKVVGAESQVEKPAAVACVTTKINYGADESVIVRWTEAAAAQTYIVSICDENGVRVMTEAGLTGTSFDFGNLKPGSYYVYAYGVNDAGAGQSSDLYHFTVAEPDKEPDTGSDKEPDKEPDTGSDKEPDSTGPALPDRCYIILSAMSSSHILEVDSGGSDYLRINKFSDESRQQFSTYYVDGVYYLISRESGKAIVAAPDGTVYQARIDGSNAQKWRLTMNYDGSWYIVSAADGRYLTVEGGAASDGASVRVEPYSGDISQHWFFADYASDTPAESQPPKLSYADISPSDWYYDAVCFVHDNGFMIGTNGGGFEPYTVLTREQAATIIARLSGGEYLKYAGLVSFTDVDVNRWSAAAIAWGQAAKVINGVGGNRFNPTGEITVEQFEVMLQRHFGITESWSGNKTRCNRALAANLLQLYCELYD